MVKGDRQVKVGNATESKQFNRELTLPEFVDVKSLQSYLADDGMLTMEAPVLMDRVYHESAAPAITSTGSYRQASPGRVLDTTFAGGRPSSGSHFGLAQGTNPGNSYSSTSSSSSFRQENNSSGAAPGLSSFHRNSPLRDQYSSTSSASTLVGGGGVGNSSSYYNPPPVTFATTTSRPVHSSNDRHDGTKNVTYEFDLHDFAPEDIAIQVNDTMLKVNALRRDRSGNSSAHHEFKREIGKRHSLQSIVKWRTSDRF